MLVIGGDQLAIGPIESFSFDDLFGRMRSTPMATKAFASLAIAPSFSSAAATDASVTEPLCSGSTNI